jgi:drug/metabolite transporter (DMT)-like permease
MLINRKRKKRGEKMNILSGIGKALMGLGGMLIVAGYDQFQTEPVTGAVIVVTGGIFYLGGWYIDAQGYKKEYE